MAEFQSTKIYIYIHTHICICIYIYIQDPLNLKETQKILKVIFLWNINKDIGHAIPYIYGQYSYKIISDITDQKQK